MIANKKIQFEKSKWDRCTRNGSARIGTKSLLYHTFSPLLKSPSDVDVYLKSLKTNSAELKHAKMMIFPLIESHKTIMPLLGKASSKQLNLYGQLSNQFEKDVVESIPIVIDPCMEYTWYKQCRENLSQVARLPKELQTLLSTLLRLDKQLSEKRISKPEYNQKSKNIFEQFWLGLIKDPKKMTNVITRMLDIQNSLGSDIGLPPVPPVYSPELLEVTKLINKISQAIWVGENCATYLVLTPELLYSDVQMKMVIDYLRKTTSKFIVIKIKYLALDKVSYINQREMFKQLMESINGIKQFNNDERIFVMLEAGIQFYPALAGGFDVVSTSMSSLDMDGKFGRSINHGFGSWYDPKFLTIRSFQDVKKLLRLHGVLPCHCPICPNIKEIKKRKEWNNFRRQHYLYTTSALAQEIDNFVDKQKIELVQEKISKSALSNFKRMLPFVS